MLFTIALILIILWAAGLISGYVLGGFLHILLVLVIVLVIIEILTRARNTPPGGGIGGNL